MQDESSAALLEQEEACIREGEPPRGGVPVERVARTGTATLETREAVLQLAVEYI